MKRYALIFLALTIFPSQAMALSCAQPMVNEETVGQTDLIFEGRPIEIIKGKKYVDKDGRLNHSKLGNPMDAHITYKFSVEKLWKGDIPDKEVLMVKNGYWGDTFKVNDAYLVFASKKDDQYESPLCGNTTSLYYAGDKIQKLKNLINTEEKEN